MQPQKISRDFKFWIQEVGGLFYLCSGNESADQLRSKNSGFQMMGLMWLLSVVIGVLLIQHKIHSINLFCFILLVV